MGGISPVDMQVMITKSVEVAKQYGQDIHKGVANQQNAAEDEARLREEQTKRVHDRRTSERIYETDEDGSNNSEPYKGNENEEKEEKSEDEMEEKPKTYEGVMGHFDMKI
ncbi:MAG: hypothetical protein E7314_03250 [Clostridiales bacterium]|nr:hypothetical protein [Clostridiales bacterium]